MKLDRRHLIGSVALLAASIVYNVWVFTRPSGAAVFTAPPMAAAGAPTAGAAAAAPIDPAQVQNLPDVVLDRLPVWPRDPFADPRPPAPEVMESVAEVAAPAAESDPVVASILHSSDRRLAMIDGRIVRVGDVVGTATVVDILPDAVVLESPLRGRRTVTIRPAGGTVTPR